MGTQNDSGRLKTDSPQPSVDFQELTGYVTVERPAESFGQGPKPGLERSIVVRGPGIACIELPFSASEEAERLENLIGNRGPIPSVSSEGKGP